jgi:hypothetical protein
MFKNFLHVDGLKTTDFHSQALRVTYEVENNTLCEGHVHVYLSICDLNQLLSRRIDFFLIRYEVFH